MDEGQGLGIVVDSEKQSRDDANELLNAAVNYAKRMLRKYGEFGPFGFSLNQQRELVNETVPRKDLPPDPAMLLQLLLDQLTERSSHKEIIAAATAANVTLAKTSEEGFSDALLVCNHNYFSEHFRKNFYGFGNAFQEFKFIQRFYIIVF